MQNDDSKKQTIKRYATATIIVGGGAILGASLLASSAPKNYGLPVTHNGQRYYIPNDSRRVVYPSREACLQDVPPSLQSECEPVDNYRSGGGGWYGPVYSSRNTTGYRPSSQYPTELADSSNVGKRLPSTANTTGFGENGKAFTGSKGG